MPFETLETSIQDGKPIELYKFERRTMRWYQTSAGEDFTQAGITYSAAPLKRTRLEANANEERSELKVSMTRDNPVAEVFRVTPPSDVVTLTLYRVHHGDTDARVVWVGRILSVDWRGAEAVLSCEPANVSMNRNGLRRLYQRQCPHRLYGPACRVNRTLYETVTTLAGVTGATVSALVAGSMPAGYLNGGVLEWTTPDGLIERRMIIGHSGTNITLTQAIPDMPGNALVTLAPGCDHTLGANGCARFSNSDNYGGMPFIPLKNPHGGTQIY